MQIQENQDLYKIVNDSKTKISKHNLYSRYNYHFKNNKIFLSIPLFLLY
jgi:hypothetical protein